MKEIMRLFSVKYYSFTLKSKQNFKVSFTEIYQWIRCELVTDPMESAKNNLGTAVLTD